LSKSSTSPDNGDDSDSDRDNGNIHIVFESTRWPAGCRRGDRVPFDLPPRRCPGWPIDQDFGGGRSGVRYVHGYTGRESRRLREQAEALVDLLHAGVGFAPGSLVLEAGCGVGAQTLTLARRSPGARFLAVDLNGESLAEARRRVAEAGIGNVAFQRVDLTRLPYADGAFDHIFVCFVLEHLADPTACLRALHRLIRPGGTLTAIEGDHGSAFFHPPDPLAARTIQCLVDLQARAGGDALIGRRLYALLRDAGFAQVRVEPVPVYVDAGRPALIQGFTRNTFIAMVQSVRHAALTRGLMRESDWDRGIAALERTTRPDGSFCYQFFRAVAAR
jgi:SAM-dependent methyltransferase